MSTPLLPRRTWLKTVLAASASLTLRPWAGAAGAAEEAFTFLAINDLHFVDPARCGPWFHTLAAAMRASAPEADFCLVGGDLAENGTAAQLGGMKEALGGLKMPFYVTPGNHDYATQTDRSAFDQLFPSSANYSFLHRGWQFVVLDTTEGQKYEATTINPATFTWMDAELPKLDRHQPVVLMTHFPLGSAPGRFTPVNAPELLRRLQPLDVRAIFSGHYHGYTQLGFQNGLMTTDRCCGRANHNFDGTTEKGWFVCRAEQGTITRTFVQIPAALRA